MELKLTLSKGKTIAHQREAVHDQQHVLKCSTVDTSPIDAVSGTPSHRYVCQDKEGSEIRWTKEMYALWKDPYTPMYSCPARDAKCHRCGKMSHFGAVYLTGLLNTMGENDAAYDQCESIHKTVPHWTVSFWILWKTPRTPSIGLQQLM